MTSRTSGQGTTTYSYNAAGNMKTATLPDGRHLEYLLDAQGDRVAKQVDGQTTARYLYGPEAITPVAQVDASGNTTARYVYGNSPSTPEYVVQNSNTYRLITDQLGSVRQVVNTQTGAVAQELTYDPYGKVLTDSNPGFQPFGFAGGLYDSDTGLVHFGQREYDPGLGRFTSSDPLGFDGGSLNLHGYVLGDPVNFVDPEGTMGFWEELATRTVGVMDGVTFGATDKLRDLLGLQGGLDKCTGEYQGARGHGDKLSFLVPIGGGAAASAKAARAVKASNAASRAVRSQPANLAEKFTLDEAMGGAGRRIMQGRIKDPRYPENVWAKMEHVHNHPGGGRTVIHYWENLRTGAREGFKFK